MKPSSQQIESAFKMYLNQNPLTNKLSIDETLKVSDGKLGVNTAKMAQDNIPLSITADAVYERVGNLESIKK